MSQPESPPPLRDTEEDFVDTGDVSLHYRLERGSGSSTVVFINALGTDLGIWDGVTAALDPGIGTLRYDKRGHGLSGAPLGDYHLEDHRHDVLSVMELGGVEQATLVGISVGGLIAMDLALKVPARVSGLVLCDTSARIGTPELWTQRMKTVRNRGLPAVAENIAGRWFAPSFADRRPAAYQRCLTALKNTPEPGYIGTCATLRDADLRTTIPTLEHPALVLNGAEDLPTPPDAGRELARALPRGRFGLIEDAGHLPPVEQPRAIAEYLTDFLAERHHD